MIATEMDTTKSEWLARIIHTFFVEPLMQNAKHRQFYEEAETDARHPKGTLCLRPARGT